MSKASHGFHVDKFYNLPFEHFNYNLFFLNRHIILQKQSYSYRRTKRTCGKSFLNFKILFQFIVAESTPNGVWTVCHNSKITSSINSSTFDSLQIKKAFVILR